MASKKKPTDMQLHYQRKVRSEVARAPWVLRFTEHKDKPAPVFIIKERIHPDQRTDTNGLVAPRSVLKERGLLYGPQQQRCLPVIRTILSRICDPKGIPLELGQYLNGRRIEFRGNLPLDDEAGLKLALMFKLQERIRELDRVEIRFGNEDHYRKLTGWLVTGDQLRPLPVGTSINPAKAAFCWQMGLAFIGQYRLFFIIEDQYGNRTGRNVLMNIMPKYSHEKEDRGRQLHRF